MAKSVAAAEKLEFMVVHDHFLTPTARYADILLPATTFWERNDVHTPWAGAGHYALFMQQAIAPMDECRNDLDICADLAGRLGLTGYNDKTEEQWLRELTKDTIDDFDTFRAKGLARLPAPEDAVAFAREIRDPEHHPFTTPSGKIEIYSMAIAANPDPYGLGAISPIPTWIPDPEEGRHPLRLVTPKSRARTHSIHDNQPILSRADRDDVWMNTADAAARGIVDGQSVRVFNERGATVLPGARDRSHRARLRLHQGRRLVHARRPRPGHARLRQRPHRRPRLAGRRRRVQQHLRGDCPGLAHSPSAAGSR